MNPYQGNPYEISSNPTYNLPPNAPLSTLSPHSPKAQGGCLLNCSCEKCIQLGYSQVLLLQSE